MKNDVVLKILENIYTNFVLDTLQLPVFLLIPLKKCWIYFEVSKYFEKYPDRSIVGQSAIYYFFSIFFTANCSSPQWSGLLFSLKRLIFQNIWKSRVDSVYIFWRVFFKKQIGPNCWQLNCISEYNTTT